MPKVSVIIPTYNRAHLVGGAIQSVLAQTYEDFSLIVVDDGSTDETRQVVESFHDARIHYVFQPHLGHTRALNACLETSSSPYVTRLDSDDTYLPEYLEAHVAFLDQHPEIGLVGSGMQVLDEDGQLIWEIQPWLGYPKLNLNAWLCECHFGAATMVRRKWLDRVGGFDPRLRLLDDWDLYLRLAYAGCPMAYLERSLYCALHHSSRSRRDVRSMEQAATAILDKLFAQPDVPPYIVAQADKVYAHWILRAAPFGYLDGEADLAKQAVARAIERDPSLMDERGERVYELFAAMAGSHFVKDPVRYAKAVFDNLPPSADTLRRRRGEGIALAAMTTFFRAHRKKDWGTVRAALGQAIRYDPSWLRNRGVISIFLESLLGPRVMLRIRALSHWLRDLRRAF